MVEKAPNLFDFATSELSQDALLAWLISWADPQYEQSDPEVHESAAQFVRLLLDVPASYAFHSVTVGRQWQSIDVWAEINSEYFLLIEDKTGTREHTDQLKRYLEIAKAEYEPRGMRVVPIYFKMEEQGIWSGIIDAGYRVIRRSEVLETLAPYARTSHTSCGNNILHDYYSHLCRLDDEVASYARTPLKDWEWHSWQGFFSAIRGHFDGEWDYVPNAAGGFLGFWWDWRYSTLGEAEFEYYLQLEYDRLIFKLWLADPEYRVPVRKYYREHLYSQAAAAGVEVEQYGRLGTYMGVARLRGDYRISDANGLLDFAGTVENLRRTQALLDDVESKLNAAKGAMLSNSSNDLGNLGIPAVTRTPDAIASSPEVA